MSLRERKPIAAPDDDDGVPTVRWPPTGAILFGVAAIVGLVVRWWQISGRAPTWWQDSTDYQTSSTSALWSAELWSGARSPGIPLLLKITGGEPGTAFVHTQVVLAAGCWAWLAAAVAPVRRGPMWRWLAAAAVVAFSLTTPITMWDRSVLAESMAISLLAALVASALWLRRSPSPTRVAVTLLIAAAWVATKDTNAVGLLVAASCLLGYQFVQHLLARQRHGHHVGSRLAVITALGFLLLSSLSMFSSTTGNRGIAPLAHVFAVRILPFPDRLDWFADHGMPQGDLLREQVAEIDPSIGTPVAKLPRSDLLEPWWAWLHEDGRATFARWMVTHPGYLIAEPLAQPERSFNNAEGDLTFYRPSDMTHVPLITDLLWFNTPTAALAGCLILGWCLRRGRRPLADALVVGAVCLLAAGPQALVAWHSDGMETTRHLVLPVVQLRLGILLAAIGALVTATNERASRPRSESVPADEETPTTTPTPTATRGGTDDQREDDRASMV